MACSYTRGFSSVAFQGVFYLIMASNSQSSSTLLNVQVLTNALSLFTNAVQAAASNSSTSQSVSINQSDLVDGTISASKSETLTQRNGNGASV